jgi:ribosomal protein S27AE
MIQRNQKTCPKCSSPKFKAWPELTDEEKMLAEKLPGSAVYSLKERKMHRFCTRCWFEDSSDGELRA